MNNIIIKNLIRFLILVCIQVLVLRSINLGGSVFNYISIMLYPIFLFIMPMNIPSVLYILIGFLTGITVDTFYDSPGIHAATCTFITFVRPLILGILEPPSGYKEDLAPVKKHFGIGWYFGYVSIMLFLFLFFYFSVEAFTFVYIKEILIRTISSFVISLIFVLIYSFIFDPE